jgi:hypothetical protein
VSGRYASGRDGSERRQAPEMRFRRTETRRATLALYCAAAVLVVLVCLGLREAAVQEFCA